MYSLLFAYLVSLLLLTGQLIIAALPLAGLVLVVAVRLPREEALMLAKFGEAYRDYMRTTGRFFPRLKAPAPGIDRSASPSR